MNKESLKEWEAKVKLLVERNTVRAFICMVVLLLSPAAHAGKMKAHNSGQGGPKPVTLKYFGILPGHFPKCAGEAINGHGPQGDFNIQTNPAGHEGEVDVEIYRSQGFATAQLNGGKQWTAYFTILPMGGTTCSPDTSAWNVNTSTPFTNVEIDVTTGVGDTSSSGELEVIYGTYTVTSTPQFKETSGVGTCGGSVTVGTKSGYEISADVGEQWDPIDAKIGFTFSHEDSVEITAPEQTNRQLEVKGYKRPVTVTISATVKSHKDYVKTIFGTQWYPWQSGGGNFSETEHGSLDPQKQVCATCCSG